MAHHTSHMEPAGTEWVDPSLYPFTHHWIEIDGNLVHYVDEGAGPALLLLHGNPTWSFVYRDLIRGLRDSYRCIALDYPGFGLSQPHREYRATPEDHAAVVEHLVQALGLRDITLMVHDWGGPIGLGVAGRHPELFRAFIIGDTFAWPVDGEAILQLFSRIMGGPLGWFLIRYFNAFVNLLIPLGVRRRKLPRIVLDHYRRPFQGSRDARLPTWILPRAIRHSRPYLIQVAALLPRLKDKPALIVWGERDPAFRTRERRCFEAIFPMHRTVILQGAGHYIQEDAAEEIITAIRSRLPEAGR
jgi:haloalkane dehalogenase